MLGVRLCLWQAVFETIGSLRVVLARVHTICLALAVQEFYLQQVILLPMIFLLNISGFGREGQVVALIFQPCPLFHTWSDTEDSYFIRNPVKLRLDAILKLISFFSSISATCMLYNARQISELLWVSVTSSITLRAQPQAHICPPHLSGMLQPLLHFPTFSLSLGQNIPKGSSHALLILSFPICGIVTGTIQVLSNCFEFRNVQEVERRSIFLLLRFLGMDPPSLRTQSPPPHALSSFHNMALLLPELENHATIAHLSLLEWPSFQRSEIFSI